MRGQCFRGTFVVSSFYVYYMVCMDCVYHFTISCICSHIWGFKGWWAKSNKLVKAWPLIFGVITGSTGRKRSSRILTYCQPHRIITKKRGANTRALGDKKNKNAQVTFFQDMFDWLAISLCKLSIITHDLCAHLCAKWIFLQLTLIINTNDSKRRFLTHHVTDQIASLGLQIFHSRHQYSHAVWKVSVTGIHVCANNLPLPTPQLSFFCCGLNWFTDVFIWKELQVTVM